METEAPFPYVDKLHKKRKRFFIQGCNLSDHLEEDDGFDDQGNAQFEILDVTLARKTQTIKSKPKF